MTEARIQTCLWFDTEALEAARRYVSLVPDSGITAIYPQRNDPEGRAFIVQFSLAGQRFTALNGGPHYRPTPAASIEVHVDTQEEVDRLWSALLEGGGRENRCGWLSDRWGVSWQVIPRNLLRYLTTEDDALAARVIAAMMGMVKLDVAALDAAARGD